MPAQETRPPIAFPKRLSTFAGIEATGQRRAPLEDIYHHILTTSWPRFILNAMVFWLVINAFFALGYTVVPGSLANARPGFEDAFYFSVQTLATVGYGVMAPATRWANILVTIEVVSGTMFTALLAGATFARFARPTAKVLFSSSLVVTPRDGVPHLMLRVANWRHNQVMDAQLRVLMLASEKTAEGEVMRRMIELPLVRNQTPFFTLTWTAMHKIGPDSPLADPERVKQLAADNAEIFVTMMAYDATLSQTVHALHRYLVRDIRWNARHADVLTIRPDGSRIVDYTRFHDVEPID